MPIQQFAPVTFGAFANAFGEMCEKLSRHRAQEMSIQFESPVERTGSGGTSVQCAYNEA